MSIPMPSLTDTTLRDTYACVLLDSIRRDGRTGDIESLARIILEDEGLHEAVCGKCVPPVIRELKDLRASADWVLRNAEPLSPRWWAACVVLVSDMPERIAKWQGIARERKNKNLKNELITKGRRRK